MMGPVCRGALTGLSRMSARRVEHSTNVSMMCRLSAGNLAPTAPRCLRVLRAQAKPASRPPGLQRFESELDAQGLANGHSLLRGRRSAPSSRQASLTSGSRISALKFQLPRLSLSQAGSAEGKRDCLLMPTDPPSCYHCSFDSQVRRVLYRIEV